MAKKSKKNVISVLGRDDDGRSADRDGTRKLSWSRSPVPTGKLQRQLAKFLDGMEDVVRSLPEKLGTLELDSVSFTVEVTAKGSISLLGLGGEAGGTGGLTFTLKRSQSNDRT